MAAQAATAATRALVGRVNSGVAEVFSRQKEIEAEAKHLQASLAQFQRMSGHWLAMVEGLSDALKEIGDVDNWARRIEADMRSIADSLEYVYARRDDEVLQAVAL